METMAILELEQRLIAAGIPHEKRPKFDGYIIFYPSEKNKVGDVIQFTGSIGAKSNLMEAMGFTIKKKEVEGCIDVDKAFQYFLDANNNASAKL